MSVLAEGAAFGEIAMSFFVACATIRGNWSDVGLPPLVAVAVLGATAMSLLLTWQCLSHVSRRGNIWWSWQPKCWTNCCVPMFQFGLALICPKHSLEYVGQHCGVPCPDRAFKPNMIWVFQNLYRNRKGQVCAKMFAVDGSRYMVVCDKAAFWVAGF